MGTRMVDFCDKCRRDEDEVVLTRVNFRLREGFSNGHLCGECLAAAPQPVRDSVAGTGKYAGGNWIHHYDYEAYLKGKPLRAEA